MFKKMGEGMLNRTREKYKETMALARVDDLMNELGESLRQIGVNGIVHVSESLEDSAEGALVGGVLGYVEIEGRNIDLVQVEMSGLWGQEERDSYPFYLFHYVVRANVEGLEDVLNAEVKPIEKGFLSSEVVDFRWEGGELAQRLNGDSELKEMMLREGLDQLPDIEVTSPIKKPPLRQFGITKQQKDAINSMRQKFRQCVRITKRPKKSTITEAHKALRKETHKQLVWGHRVGVELPTRETFEIYERIAKHIRNIAGAQPT